MKSFNFTVGPVAVVAGALFFLGALGFVGANDYRETVRQAVNYCDMVRAGYWPDYDGLEASCPAVYREAVEVLGPEFKGPGPDRAGRRGATL